MGSCTTYDPASASFEDFDYNASEVTTLCFLPEEGDTSPDGLMSLQPSTGWIRCFPIRTSGQIFKADWFLDGCCGVL